MVVLLAVVVAVVLVVILELSGSEDEVIMVLVARVEEAEGVIGVELSALISWHPSIRTSSSGILATRGTVIAIVVYGWRTHTRKQTLAH